MSMPISILVVEDEPAVRRVLVRLLESQGYQVREAAAAPEALEGLERQPADLVLTDVHMPGMDGVQLLNELRRRHPDTGVMLITAVGDVRTAVTSLQQGALDYVAKPFQAEEAVARVRQALERQRLIRENRAYHLTLETRVREQAERIRAMFVQGVQALAHALEAKDPYTRGHSRRVAAYSTATAERLGLAPEMVQEIRLGAELHDIGKIGVREAVLCKAGPLTDEEYGHIKEHPVIGERILSPLFADRPVVLAVVRSHHERPDGTGFPDGLRGVAIPIAAHVAAVADTFDAMTTMRPYRSALSVSTSLDELRRHAGTQFDPDAVEAFLMAFPDPSRLPLTEGLAEPATPPPVAPVEAGR